MLWVVLSPHLDDAVYSLGGWLAWRVQQGDRVEVWTVCAGEPPPEPLSLVAQVLHQMWGLQREEVVATRRAEDHAACRLLGLTPRHLEVPDAIYRRDATGEPLYPDFDALTGSLHPTDEALVETLADHFRREWPAEARVVAPMAIGGHVDHRLARAAAEATGRVAAYYADFPYAAREGLPALRDLPRQGWWVMHPLPPSEAWLQVWVQGVQRYASQQSAFWASDAALEEEVRAFAGQGGGSPWLPPEAPRG